MSLSSNAKSKLFFNEEARMFPLVVKRHDLGENQTADDRDDQTAERLRESHSRSEELLFGIGHFERSNHSVARRTDEIERPEVKENSSHRCSADLVHLSSVFFTRFAR